MRLRGYDQKVRKSLGLIKPGSTQEGGRFNLALAVLEDQAEVAAESRSMVEKLRDSDFSTSIIQNNQSFREAERGTDACDWTLLVDLRSATNLSSR